MTTMVEVNAAIRTLFNAPVTGWDARHPTVTLAYRGDDFDPTDGEPYARVTILGGALAEQVEFGNERRFRRPGILRVQFYLVAGDGSGLAYEFGDSVKEILEGNTSTGVRFFQTTLPIEEAAEGAFDRWRVDTDFDADELRAV